jgi:glutathione-regulated potassium-efflux system ancillary protein KefG
MTFTYNVGSLSRRVSIGEEEMAARGDDYRQLVRNLGEVSREVAV